MILLGLIGKDLSHSFSGRYFSDKFSGENLDKSFEYRLFEIPEINQIFKLIELHPNLSGFNVTIPYKEAIFPLLDFVAQEAIDIGAVNTVKIERVIGSDKNFILKGYNTDARGFEISLRPLLESWHQKAIVLGTGGAAKAVCYTLKKLNIDFIQISRQSHSASSINYSQIDERIMEEHLLIVNTTPAGTFPKVNECPPLPYHLITSRHLLFDLVYNPPETLFLKKGIEQGAFIKNGYEMLVQQAELSWQIWNRNDSV